MQSLRNIIIARIVDLHQLKLIPAVQPSPSRQQRPQTAQLTSFSSNIRLLRQRQRKRLADELGLIDKFQEQNPTAQEVRWFILEIAFKYNPQFKQMMTSLGQQANAQQLFLTFLGKPTQTKLFAMVHAALPISIADVGVVKSCFQLGHQCKNAEQAGIYPVNQCQTGSQLIDEGKYDISSLFPGIVTNSLYPQYREQAMAMMKAELSAHYALLGGCLDLDFQFINRLARPKKANPQKHFHEIVGYLIKYANGPIAASIAVYSQEYEQKYRKYQSVHIKKKEQEDNKNIKKFVKNSNFDHGYSMIKQRSTIVRKNHTALTSKSRMAVTKMTLFDNPWMATKNSLRKMGNNPQQRDPYAFNFIKRNQQKQKRDLFRSLNSTSLVSSGLKHKSEKEIKEEGKLQTEPKQSCLDQSSLVSKSQKVVICQLFGDKSINKALVKMQNKQDSLRAMRQGLLGVGFKSG